VPRGYDGPIDQRLDSARIERLPSKRLSVRLPSSLHEQASLAAASEGVSLNQFVCALLAGAVQWQLPASDRSEGRYPKTKEELGDRLWADVFR
jgi:hypothetical protein